VSALDELSNDQVAIVASLQPRSQIAPLLFSMQ
jgi:hypothetical protein